MPKQKTINYLLTSFNKILNLIGNAVTNKMGNTHSHKHNGFEFIEKHILEITLENL